MKYQGLKIADFLFDATGIARSFPLNAVIWRTEGIALGVEKQLGDPKILSVVKKMLGSDRYVDFLSKSISYRKTPSVLLNGTTN